MSITKPSEDSGKTIESIIPHKSYVEVIVSDGEKFKIDINSYLNGERMYPGKDVSLEEIKSLTETANSLKDYNYFVRLISGSKLYSKKEIVSKLMSVRHLSYPKANQMLEVGYSQGLINDESYIHNYVNDAYEKGYSKELIKKNLSLNGYSLEEVDKAIDEIPEDYSPIKDIVQSEFLSLKGRNEQANKQRILVKLNKLGYSSSESNKLIKEFYLENKEFKKDAEKKTLDNLRSDMKLMLESLKGKEDSDFQLKDKIIRRLSGRKYEYDDIINIYKELTGK